MLNHNQLTRIRDTLVNDLGFNFIALAGGAPRDMYLGREPRDYDFYCNLYSVGTILFDDLENAGFSNVEHSGSTMTDSEGNELTSVTFDFSHHTINLILCSHETVEDLFGAFSCSLSQFYYDFITEQPVPNKAAKLSMATQTLTFTPDVAAHYRAKILRYFPDYTETSYDQIVFNLLAKELDRAPRSLHTNSRRIVDEAEGLFPLVPSMLVTRGIIDQQARMESAHNTMYQQVLESTIEDPDQYHWRVEASRNRETPNIIPSLIVRAVTYDTPQDYDGTPLLTDNETPSFHNPNAWSVTAHSTVPF